VFKRTGDVFKKREKSSRPRTGGDGPSRQKGATFKGRTKKLCSGGGKDEEIAEGVAYGVARDWRAMSVKGEEKNRTQAN